MVLDRAITRATRLGTSMPITGSLSSPMATTNDRRRMLTSIWIGTMCYRSLHLRYHKKHHALSASHTRLLLGWLRYVWRRSPLCLTLDSPKSTGNLNGVLNLQLLTRPRRSQCGHIFCLPCIIRYMHSTDDTNPLPEKKARCKKCPICWDLVFISETRPVRWYTGQESPQPREGDDVVLRLVMRQPGRYVIWKARFPTRCPRNPRKCLALSRSLP
jgi:hypothetical protein